MIQLNTNGNRGLISLSNKSRSPIADLDAGDGVDPMSGITNLVDVMLVFACGLILSIIAFWKLDLPTITEIVDEQELVEVEDVEEVEAEVSGSSYSELGTVYEDQETGKRYMIEETSE